MNCYICKKSQLYFSHLNIPGTESLVGKPSTEFTELYVNSLIPFRQSLTTKTTVTCNLSGPQIISSILRDLGNFTFVFTVKYI